MGRIRIGSLHSFTALALLLAMQPLAAGGFPEDVTEFLDERELCVHFSQEPWPEGSSTEEIERRTFIARQINRFCTGLNEIELNLRRKYRDQRAVIEELDKHKAYGLTQ